MTDNKIEKWIFCPNCGTKLIAESKYCANCGKTMTALMMGESKMQATESPIDDDIKYKSQETALNIREADTPQTSNKPSEGKNTFLKKEKIIPILLLVCVLLVCEMIGKILTNNSESNKGSDSTKKSEYVPIKTITSGVVHETAFEVMNLDAMSETMLIEYNENGDVSKTWMFDKDGKIHDWNENIYRYDNEKIRKAICKHMDGSWSESEYDNNGNSIKSVGYDSGGKIVYWYENEFDAKGNRIKSTRYNEDGAIVESSEDKYDKNDNIIQNIIYNPDGKIINKTKYKNEYDKNKNLIKQTKYDSDGEIYESVEYEYDENGLVTNIVGHYDNGLFYYSTIVYDLLENVKGKIIEMPEIKTEEAAISNDEDDASDEEIHNWEEMAIRSTKGYWGLLVSRSGFEDYHKVIEFDTINFGLDSDNDFDADRPYKGIRVSCSGSDWWTTTNQLEHDDTIKKHASFLPDIATDFAVDYITIDYSRISEGILTNYFMHYYIDGAPRDPSLPVSAYFSVYKEIYRNYATIDEAENKDNQIDASAELNTFIGEVVVNVDNLRIRNVPSVTDSEIVGYAKKGETYNIDEVYIAKKDANYTWYRIGDNQYIADDGSWLTVNVDSACENLLNKAKF